MTVSSATELFGAAFFGAALFLVFFAADLFEDFFSLAIRLHNLLSFNVGRAGIIRSSCLYYSAGLPPPHDSKSNLPPIHTQQKSMRHWPSELLWSPTLQCNATHLAYR